MPELCDQNVYRVMRSARPTHPLGVARGRPTCPADAPQAAAPRRIDRPGQPAVGRAARIMWAIDVQFDQTADGRNLRLLHVVDEFTREALAIERHRRIDADKTVSVLEQLVLDRGTAPGVLRYDNGPEMTANAIRDWCRFSRAGSAYIEPGSPWENPYVESFRRPRPRRTARRGAVLLPDGSLRAYRRPASGLQRPRPHSALGIHDGLRSDALRTALTAGGPMNSKSLPGTHARGAHAPRAWSRCDPKGRSYRCDRTPLVNFTIWNPPSWLQNQRYVVPPCVTKRICVFTRSVVRSPLVTLGVSVCGPE